MQPWLLWQPSLDLAPALCVRSLFNQNLRVRRAMDVCS